MSYILRTQEHAQSQIEEREAESLQFCISIGENGGFYKVQIVDAELGIIIHEFKSE